MKTHPLARHLLISALAAAALTACGGGSDDPAPIAQPITGTAASGAPVVGTVTVKDSTGATRTSTIGADGIYSVNVAGMSGPFVFLASGTVGGRTVSMVSAATAADIGKTINITPFTDLIVANMAGEAASTYYAAPTFSKLTATDLDAARQTLTARLLPILNSLRVAAGFDLLRSSFAADHSGFDAVMDVVRVSTDEIAKTATISDLVNHTQIQDDLTIKTDATVIPAPAVDPNSTVTSLKGIEDTLTKFSAAFATGIPAPNNPALLALMSSDFLDWGGGVGGFLSDQGVLVAGMVGVKQSGASIVAVKDGGATLDVEFLSAYKGGGSDRWQHEFKRDTNSGVWQYAGNRKWAYLEVSAIMARFHNTDDTWGYAGNLGWWMTSRNADAAYALLSGPGIGNYAPASLASVALSGTVLGKSDGAFKFYSSAGVAQGTWLPDCAAPHGGDASCVNVSAVSDEAVYSVTLLNASGVAIGTPQTIKLAGRPYTIAESSAAGNAWFARIASTDPLTKAGLVDGKRMSFTLTPPTDPGHTIKSAAIAAPPTYFPEVPVTGTSVDLGVWHGATPAGTVEATVESRDAIGRRFRSYYFLN